MSTPQIWSADDAGPTFANVLVVVAHPDDCEAGCAGSVCRLIDNGAAAHLVVATSGDKGSSDPTMTSERLAALREAEQRRAAEVLGLASVTFLRHGDGELPEAHGLLGDLVREIRRRQPDLVITHDGVNHMPEYFCHRDHRALGRAVLDAIYPSARDAVYFPSQLHDEGLSVWRVGEAWLFSSSIADLYVDIAATMERRLEARLCHVTQTADPVALRERYMTRIGGQGERVGLRYAESFKRLVVANR